MNDKTLLAIITIGVVVVIACMGIYFFFNQEIVLDFEISGEVAENNASALKNNITFPVVNIDNVELVVPIVLSNDGYFLS